jgi:hypothetical protein
MIDCNKENESNMHVVSTLTALSYVYSLMVDNGGTHLNLTQTSHYQPQLRVCSIDTDKFMDVNVSLADPEGSIPAFSTITATQITFFFCDQLYTSFGFT